METRNTSQLIDEMKASVQDQLKHLKTWAELPLERLEERPAPRSWSVVEVIEHLNISSGHYTRRLGRIYAGGKALGVNANFTPGRWGESFTRSMQPLLDGTIPKPMRTLWLFEPKAAAAKGKASLQEFQDMLEEQLVLLERAGTMGWEGPKITSTLGPIFRFKIGDAFRFMVAHQARHFLQAERALANVGETQRSVLSTI